MTDHHTSLDASLARSKPAGGEVPAVSDGAASPVGEGVHALADELTAGWDDEPTEAEQELALSMARNVMHSDWLAARDARVAAAAEVAAGERIARAIEAEVARFGQTDAGDPVRVGLIEGYRDAARIARITRADRGGDRG